VQEIEFGETIGEVARRVGVDADDVQAVLAGGYFGGWLDGPKAWAQPLELERLRAAGSRLRLRRHFLPRSARLRRGGDGGGLVSGSSTGRKLHVDRIRCDEPGACARLLPKLIELDDWGYPILAAGRVPGARLFLARRAVEACPVPALRASAPGAHPAPPMVAWRSAGAA